MTHVPHPDFTACECRSALAGAEGGQYVRGVVVEHQGETALLPTGLVGAWRTYDLPRRGPDGVVGYSTGGHFLDPDFTPWRPSDTCVYEAPAFVAPRGDGAKINPTIEPLIGLSLPEMTDDDKRVAQAHAAVKAAVEGLNGAREVEEAIKEAIEILQAGLGEP